MTTMTTSASMSSSTAVQLREPQQQRRGWQRVKSASLSVIFKSLSFSGRAFLVAPPKQFSDARNLDCIRSQSESCLVNDKYF